MKVVRRVLRFVFGLLVILAAGLAVGSVWLQTESGRRWLIARAEPAGVTIGRIEGSVPFDMVLVDVALADRQGVWLTVDRVAVAIDPTALVRRELVITALEAGLLTVVRRPVEEPDAAPPEPKGPLRLPPLPVAADLRRLAVGAIAAGPLLPAAAAGIVGAAPRLEAEGRVTEAGAVVLRRMRLNTAAGTLTLTGGYDPAADRADLSGGFEADSGSSLHAVLPEPVPALLAGGPLRVGFTGTVFPADGTLRVDGLTLTTTGAEVAAHGTAYEWGRQAEAAVTLRLPELARLSGVAGQTLAGSARLDAEIAVEGGAVVQADVAARGEALQTGTPALDALLDGAARLSGTVVVGSGGLGRVSGLRLDTARLHARADAALAGQRLTAAVAAEVPDLAPLGAVLGAPLSGALNVSATVEGSPTAPKGTLRLQARAGGQPVDAHTGFAVENRTLALTDLVASGGGNRISGALRVALDTITATGALKGRVDDLAALSPLAGRPLRGHVTVDLDLDAANGRQGAALTAAVRDFAAGGPAEPAFTAGRIDLTAKATDLLGAAAGTVRLEAAGRAGQPLTVDLRGRIDRDGPVTRLSLERLSGQYGGEPFRLASVATAEFGDGRIAVRDLDLRSGRARLTVEAAAGIGGRGAIQGRATLVQVPLALARLVDTGGDLKGLDLGGRLDADLRLAGTLADPRAELDLKLDGVRVAPAARAGFTALDATVAARWRDRRVTVVATVAGGRGGIDLRLRAEGPLALDPDTRAITVGGTAPVDAALTGRIDLARFNDLLATAGDRVRGRLALDVTLGGTLDDPRLGGTASVADAAYENFTAGTVIRNIQARLTGEGRVFTIQSFTGTTPNGGRLQAGGRIDLTPWARDQLAVTLTATNARLVQIDWVTTDLDADLRLTGTFFQARLAGPIRVRQAEIRVPERLPPTVVALDVVEVNKPGSARGGPATRFPSQPEAQSVATLALDVAVTADNQVFVRGRGLDAEFAGRLSVTGTAAQPVVTGSLTTVRGRLDVLGKVFEFRNGTITFTGGTPIDPDLDVLAAVRAGSLTAQAQVSGTASAPKLELTSDPPLPQDEVLARVLFGKPVQQLGAGEAVQLAQSAAQLAGFGGGAGLVDRVRQSLGLDRLEFIGGGENGQGPGIAAGRYIAKDVYVGVEQGTSPNSSRAKVEIGITDNVQIEADVGANADSRVGVTVEWDY